MKVIELEFKLWSEEETGEYVDISLTEQPVKVPLFNPFRLIANRGDKVLIAAQEIRAIVIQVQHHIS